jgi:hypothetical protein
VIALFLMCAVIFSLLVDVDEPSGPLGIPGRS